MLDIGYKQQWAVAASRPWKDCFRVQDCLAELRLGRQSCRSEMIDEVCSDCRVHIDRSKSTLTDDISSQRHTRISFVGLLLGWDGVGY